MLQRVTSLHYSILLCILIADYTKNDDSHPQAIILPKFGDQFAVIFDNYTDFEHAKAYIARGSQQKAQINDQLLFEKRQAYQPDSRRVFDILRRYHTPVYEIIDNSRLVLPSGRIL